MASENDAIASDIGQLIQAAFLVTNTLLNQVLAVQTGTKLTKSKKFPKAVLSVTTFSGALPET